LFDQLRTWHIFYRIKQGHCDWVQINIIDLHFLVAVFTVFGGYGKVQLVYLLFLLVVFHTLTVLVADTIKLHFSCDLVFWNLNAQASSLVFIVSKLDLTSIVRLHSLNKVRFIDNGLQTNVLDSHDIPILVVLWREEEYADAIKICLVSQKPLSKLIFIRLMLQQIHFQTSCTHKVTFESEFNINFVFHGNWDRFIQHNCTEFLWHNWIQFDLVM